MRDLKFCTRPLLTFAPQFAAQRRILTSSSSAAPLTELSPPIRPTEVRHELRVSDLPLMSRFQTRRFCVGTPTQTRKRKRALIFIRVKRAFNVYNLLSGDLWRDRYKNVLVSIRDEFCIGSALRRIGGAGSSTSSSGSDGINYSGDRSRRRSSRERREGTQGVDQRGDPGLHRARGLRCDQTSKCKGDRLRLNEMSHDEIALSRALTRLLLYGLQRKKDSVIP